MYIIHFQFQKKIESTESDTLDYMFSWINLHSTASPNHGGRLRDESVSLRKLNDEIYVLTLYMPYYNFIHIWQPFHQTSSSEVKSDSSRVAWPDAATSTSVQLRPCSEAPVVQALPAFAGGRCWQYELTSSIYPVSESETACGCNENNDWLAHRFLFN